MNDLSSSTCPVRAEQLAELTDMPFFFCNTSNVNSSCMFPMMSTDLAPPLSSRVLCVCRIWLLHIKKFCESWSATPNVQHSPSQYCMLDPLVDAEVMHTPTFLVPLASVQTPLCVLWRPHQTCCRQSTWGRAACAPLGVPVSPAIACRATWLHQDPMDFTKCNCGQKNSVTGSLLSNGCLLPHEVHRVNNKNNAPCIIDVALNSAAYFGVSWHVHKVDWPTFLCLLSRQRSDIIVGVFSR